MPELPSEKAERLARELQNDPVAAALIKEHLGEKWLIELLELQDAMLPENVIRERKISRIEAAQIVFFGDK